MTYVDLHPEIRTPKYPIPYPKVPGPVPQSTRPRTPKYPIPYPKVPGPVPQSTRPRTPKYPAPYPLFIGATGGIAPFRSGRIAGAGAPIFGPGERLPPARVRAGHRRPLRRRVRSRWSRASRARAGPTYQRTMATVPTSPSSPVGVGVMERSLLGAARPACVRLPARGGSRAGASVNRSDPPHHACRRLRGTRPAPAQHVDRLRHLPEPLVVQPLDPGLELGDVEVVLQFAEELAGLAPVLGGRLEGRLVGRGVGQGSAGDVAASSGPVAAPPRGRR